MSDVPNLPELTLTALVGAIGADRPAPGAGAAAGVALALAAACARKAFLISARHHREDAGLAEAAQSAGRIAAEALADAQRDAADFAAVLHAHHDPAPEAALKADAKALLERIGALRDLIGRHEGRVIGALRGDLLAAESLADAAERVQRHNLAELPGAQG